ncbi:hypothetical protein I302_108320 [Kwoniella bestiolae CBS 10118]|uniref:Uncharacterized protein n=1 Tax=Kwoniella bestiolae CBS 10118 TaxID=1296100 RepID=A0A1B9FW35_9TREE|nr:hypothetical protein I302_07311 [Kwoniella bestiolae CBS 10118]OCF22961.1 hypothetical protein I302_07311 [Kwoniella bestiolae CBS 10118]
MNDQYNQDGWGPLQEPFHTNTFPTYSALRDTYEPFNNQLILDPSLTVEDTLPAYPVPYSSSFLPSSSNDGINLYQPRYQPYINELPQTPSQQSFIAQPPSISPRDIHTPRFAGLEITLPVFEPNIESQSSPLADHTKMDHNEYTMGSDTDSDSESDSEFDFVPPAPVNRNLITALSQGSSVPAQSPSASLAGNEELGSPSKDLVQSAVPSVPVLVEHEVQTDVPSPITTPTLVNSPLVKSTRVKAGKTKAMKAVVQKPKDKKASSGRQVLLAKKVKPGRGPRATKKALNKKIGTAKQSKKELGLTTALSLTGSAGSNNRLEPSSQTSVPSKRKSRSSPTKVNSGISKKISKPNNAIQPSCGNDSAGGFRKTVGSHQPQVKLGKGETSIKVPTRLASKSVPKPKSTEAEAISNSKGKNVKSTSILRKVMSLVDDATTISIPPSPASFDHSSDVEDGDYHPSPSPALQALENVSDDEVTSPLPPKKNSKKKRSRSEDEDDDDWGKAKKSHKKKAKHTPDDIPLKDRKINKARNQFYHPGRQEQNVRAQSRYRNKIKARGDLVLCYFKKVLEEKRKSKSAKSFKDSVGLLEKEFLMHMKDLDASFAQAEFGTL